MKITSLHIGQRVRHPQHGTGEVTALTTHAADIRFDDGTPRSLDPEAGGLEPAEALASVSGLSMPLQQLLEETVESTVTALGLERASDKPEELGARWHGGRLVMHPAESTLQTKEVPLEIFFKKVVAVRNNLRVLEQKVNAHTALSSAEKFDWQQYITRCYGSLTTFNVLFRDKQDQFRSGN